MVKRFAVLLMALLMAVPADGLADGLKLKENTPAQKALKTYIENVNGFLAEMGELEVNSLFEEYNDHAELGITSLPDAETAEHAEATITVYLYYGSIDRMVLRTRDPEHFSRIAGAFLQGLEPERMTRQEALKIPAARAGKAIKNPLDSFEEEVEVLNGEVPRTYYAYYPNQYRDGYNWIQMTVIFPIEGKWDENSGVISGSEATKAPSYDADQDKEYEGYYSRDDYEHLEVFTTATPEPDSAAAELDNWWEKTDK